MPHFLPSRIRPRFPQRGLIAGFYLQFLHQRAWQIIPYSLYSNHLHQAATRRLDHANTEYIYIGNAPQRRRFCFTFIIKCLHKKTRMIPKMLGKTIVLEINPKLPRTFGDLQVHLLMILSI